MCKGYRSWNPEARLMNRNAGEGSLLGNSGRVKTGWSVKYGNKSKKGQAKILNQVNRVVTGRSELIFWNLLKSLAMKRKTIWQRTSGSEGAK